jgi:hypothetical protein
MSEQTNEPASKLTPGRIWSMIEHVLPDDVLQGGAVVKENVSQLRLQMGRFAQVVWTHVQKNKLPFDKDQVAAAVSHYFDDVRGMSSVRDYWRVVEFYDREILEAYTILPFSHFMYAMRNGNTPAAAQAVLDYSIQITDDRGGKPPSVIALEEHFEAHHFEHQAADLATAPADDNVAAAGSQPGRYEQVVDRVATRRPAIVDAIVDPFKPLVILRLDDKESEMDVEHARKLAAQLVNLANEIDKRFVNMKQASPKL